MVIRIWTEGSNGSLLARITSTLDVTARDQPSVGAASADQVVDAVREWIEAFIAQAP